MPEPLKNMLTPTLVSNVAERFKSVYPPFDETAFQRNVFCDEWSQKELKERIDHISTVLYPLLPKHYDDAIKVVKKVAPSFSGFEYLFFPGYVAQYGLDHYETSIDALEFLTEFSSSELAIRPFITRYRDRVMPTMEIWAESPNKHVRRLASEGCRPRLPWAMSLPAFKKDPSPVLKVLEKLKADESDYVRRSVANNLNDISKDNPEVVVQIASVWFGLSNETDRLVKHGCRTLLKQAHPEILSLFGFSGTDHIEIKHFEASKTVERGGYLTFSCELSAKTGTLDKLRIEYAIDFMKSNGKLSRKLFKISEVSSSESKKMVSRRHSFKPISTRQYYPGQHGLALIVNGQEMASASFVLK